MRTTATLGYPTVSGPSVSPVSTGTAAALGLLTELEALGVQLMADRGSLRFRPREAVSVDLANRIKARKSELLALVAARQTRQRLQELVQSWPAEWRELWEERAAIAQHEANMDRSVAEDWAYQQLLASTLAGFGIAYQPGSTSTATLLGITGNEQRDKWPRAA